MIDRRRSPDDLTHRRGRQRRRVLRATAVLPSMATLMNGICGFASIHYATKVGPIDDGHFVRAAMLLLAAMFFDGLDGRLARLTRRTSDFGGQLDSLCDAVSFGVAPAILMLRLVEPALAGWAPGWEPLAKVAGRSVWAVAAVYASCAILRLARFNVENEPDESHHLVFQGLPSPAAALVVVALVLLHAHVGIPDPKSWLSAHWIGPAILLALPPLTLAAALLMVSRLPYPHVINQYLRGRKPFGFIVKLVIVLVAAIFIDFQTTLAVVALSYLLAGPAAWGKNRWTRRHRNANAESS